MIGRLTRSLAFGAAAATLLSAAPGLHAQQASRYRVLVPDFFAAGGAKKGFGGDVANELRKKMENLATHQAIPEKEVKEQLAKFKMKEDELDCLKTRQLATQIQANLAVCATYTAAGEDGFKMDSIQVWDLGSGEPLQVDAITVQGKSAKVDAAQHIFEAFDRMVQLARAQQFCSDYANSQQWDNAMTNCNKAIELNPNAIGTRMRKATILNEQAKAETDPAKQKAFYQQSLDELKAVLKQNEFNEQALQLAGVVSISLGDPVAGREYFKKYLEVNPDASQLRLKLAYDMAQAGDPEGAMQFVKVGLDSNPNDADLLTYYAGYGVAAANKRAEAATKADAGAGLPAEAQALYREVVTALNKVVEIKGDQTGIDQYRALIASQLALGDAVTAEAVARKALALHADDALMHAQLADALQRQGKIDDAIAEMDQVEKYQPDYPSLRLRTGAWLLQAGRVDDAVAEFKKGTAKDLDPNMAANMVYADAANNGVRKENWTYALKGILAAKSFSGLSPETKATLDFWHGWTIYHQAMIAEKPQNAASAKATLPVFEQAKQLFTSGQPAAAKLGVNLKQIMDAVDTYIEIENVLIKRGR